MAGGPVANLYHKVTNSGTPAEEAEQLLGLIGAWLTACKTPALLEDGEELIPLKQGEYALEIRAGRVCIDVWSGAKSFSRRIVAVNDAGTGTLDCLIHRFGGAPGRVTFLDTAKPQTAHRKLTGERQSFAEQFRRMLYRQFPGWEVAQLSAAMDLQRSFSPSFPRAQLVKGGQRLAAMACPDALHEHAFLTFAVLWFDYLKSRGKTPLRELCLFLPESAGCLTANRLRWMEFPGIRVSLVRFNQHGSAGQVDALDLGNLESRVLNPAEQPPVPAEAGEERWLEQSVRANVLQIEPTMRETPLLGQVITFSATDRDIVDLLGVTYEGRPVILELKAETDIHLPMQALDYWMRIFAHIRNGELPAIFPGILLGTEPPLLRLVAPALAFHSTTGTILRYFSPEIDVERVGINSSWSAKLKVVLRLQKGEVPQSHGGQYERAESTWNKESHY